jgi:hypothetical protein
MRKTIGPIHVEFSLKASSIQVVIKHTHFRYLPFAVILSSVINLKDNNNNDNKSQHKIWTTVANNLIIVEVLIFMLIITRI